MVRFWLVATAVGLAVASGATASEACDEVLAIASREHPAVIAGEVEIVGCARIPGVGTELVVRGPGDPVEVFAGPEGQHIRVVVEALEGERIDVALYSDDPVRTVCAALSPVAVKRVMVDETAHAMDLVVADEDVQRAAGKEGQHLQLAAELSGWTLNLFSLTQDDQHRKDAREAMEQIPGITAERSATLLAAGFRAGSEIAAADPGELAEILALSRAEAVKIGLAAAAVAARTGTEPIE